MAEFIKVDVSPIPPPSQRPSRKMRLIVIAIVEAAVVMACVVFGALFWINKQSATSPLQESVIVTTLSGDKELPLRESINRAHPESISPEK